MGYQQQGSFALVSMTNGDVYFINRSEVEDLLGRTLPPIRWPYYTTRDGKSGAKLTIFVAHISSIVEEAQA